MLIIEIDAFHKSISLYSVLFANAIELKNNIADDFAKYYNSNDTDEYLISVL